MSALPTANRFSALMGQPASAFAAFPGQAQVGTPSAGSGPRKHRRRRASSSAGPAGVGAGQNTSPGASPAAGIVDAAAPASASVNTTSVVPANTSTMSSSLETAATSEITEAVVGLPGIGGGSRRVPNDSAAYFEHAAVVANKVGATDGSSRVVLEKDIWKHVCSALNAADGGSIFWFLCLKNYDTDKLTTTVFSLLHESSFGPKIYPEPYNGVTLPKSPQDESEAKVYSRLSALQTVCDEERFCTICRLLAPVPVTWDMTVFEVVVPRLRAGRVAALWAAKPGIAGVETSVKLRVATSSGSFDHTNFCERLLKCNPPGMLQKAEDIIVVSIQSEPVEFASCLGRESPDVEYKGLDDFVQKGITLPELAKKMREWLIMVLNGKNRQLSITFGACTAKAANAAKLDNAELATAVARAGRQFHGNTDDLIFAIGIRLWLDLENLDEEDESGRDELPKTVKLSDDVAKLIKEQLVLFEFGRDSPSIFPPLPPGSIQITLHPVRSSTIGPANRRDDTTMGLLDSFMLKISFVLPESARQPVYFSKRSINTPEPKSFAYLNRWFKPVSTDEAVNESRTKSVSCLRAPTSLGPLDMWLRLRPTSSATLELLFSGLVFRVLVGENYLWKTVGFPTSSWDLVGSPDLRFGSTQSQRELNALILAQSNVCLVLSFGPVVNDDSEKILVWCRSLLLERDRDNAPCHITVVLALTGGGIDFTGKLQSMLADKKLVPDDWVSLHLLFDSQRHARFKQLLDEGFAPIGGAVTLHPNAPIDAIDPILGNGIPVELIEWLKGRSASLDTCIKAVRTGVAIARQQSEWIADWITTESSKNLLRPLSFKLGRLYRGIGSSTIVAQVAAKLQDTFHVCIVNPSVLSAQSLPYDKNWWMGAISIATKRRLPLLVCVDCKTEMIVDKLEKSLDAAWNDISPQRRQQDAPRLVVVKAVNFQSAHSTREIVLIDPYLSHDLEVKHLTRVLSAAFPERTAELAEFQTYALSKVAKRYDRHLFTFLLVAQHPEAFAKRRSPIDDYTKDEFARQNADSKKYTMILAFLAVFTNTTTDTFMSVEARDNFAPSQLDPFLIVAGDRPNMSTALRVSLWHFELAHAIMRNEVSSLKDVVRVYRYALEAVGKSLSDELVRQLLTPNGYGDAAFAPLVAEILHFAEVKTSSLTDFHFLETAMIAVEQLVNLADEYGVRQDCRIHLLVMHSKFLRHVAKRICNKLAIASNNESIKTILEKGVAVAKKAYDISPSDYLAGNNFFEALRTTHQFEESLNGFEMLFGADAHKRHHNMISDQALKVIKAWKKATRGALQTSELDGRLKLINDTWTKRRDESVDPRPGPAQQPATYPVHAPRDRPRFRYPSTLVEGTLLPRLGISHVL